MYNDFFKVLLLGIDCIQKQNSFSVITINFEIAGFWPCRVFDEFEFYVPGRCNSQFTDIFFKKSRQCLFIYCIPPSLIPICRNISLLCFLLLNNTMVSYQNHRADMAKNRNFDRNPSRGCNYGLEGGAFLILGGATTALGGALLYPWGQQ